MAVTAFLYGQFFGQLAAKTINLTGDTNKVALATSSYTPNQDTHDFFNDITNEVTGTGYSAGGATLANDVFTYTGGTNTWMYDGDDTTWTTSTITARYAILYDTTPGTSATDPLISYLDMGADFTSSGGTFQITWNASGIWTLTLS